MQLTPFDRWLREKFVYQTHVLTLRPPPSLPKGIRTANLPDAQGARYKHLFIARSGKAADALIRQLKADGQMFMTRVVDRDAWFVPLIAPKGKSPTWWLISALLISASVLCALHYLRDLVEDPVFRDNFMKSIETMKG